MSNTIAYRAFLVTLPLIRPIPVGSASWTERPVVLLHAQDAEGHTAWGEAAPLEGYGPDSMGDVFGALTQSGWQERPMPPSLECALGTVRMGLRAMQSYHGFGQPDHAMEVSTLSPAALGLEGSLSGRSHVKIKVGRAARQDDLDRIRTVTKEHPRVRIRLDGNGMLTREEAIGLIDELGDLSGHIDYFEEPWQGCFMEDIRHVLSVPVAIDESLQDDNWHHADVCILKPSMMGDPVATLDRARRMQRIGRRVVVSSAFESQVGMTMVTWLAALLGDAAPGLGTYRFVADDWGGRPAWWEAPRIPVSDIPPIPQSPAHLENAFIQPRTFASGLRVEELPLSQS